MRKTLIRASVLFGLATAAAVLFVAGPAPRRSVKAQDNLTPGMLFGPVFVGENQRAELCASNLGDGDLAALVHFRNMDTGEVTQIETLTLKSGGGQCAFYSSPGHVVGMARGDGRASDWVSPSNALISTMSIVDESGVRISVLGNAKLWLRGL